ncbi:phosphoribosylglycinamide formyltransferase [Neorickettsia sennetsu]|uniref:Phosphoribosylglycinamide formyltransferase n=1 Tax=Ehrlichia sennetsu (strain ATCC VR-367 / Miyayama) TaxID=222891 RepID=Q2GDT7_EHRS3|nr:phosphoribosylglycinamide formyltransferase [Neorickettsia sennetsu]ABD46300.1 phosphoribosylglycinamide formyltransferase [Neorickettsia sennetsu str. Miyayama]
MRKKVAIFISGRGSNMKSLLEFSKNEGKKIFSVALVISNKPDAAGISIAHTYGIDTRICTSEEEILTVLSYVKVDLICLAGFMKILSKDFISRVGCDIINIHPSLLPSFRGLNAQAEALAAGVKIAGCTVHYVTPEVDAGKIIVQGAVPVLKNDTVKSLSERILKAEHKCFPIAVEKVLTDNVEEDFIILQG